MKNPINHARQAFETRRTHAAGWSRLEHELTGYDTEAQRQDLDATLDRYADQDTAQMRHFLAAQAVHA